MPSPIPGRSRSAIRSRSPPPSPAQPERPPQPAALPGSCTSSTTTLSSRTATCTIDATQAGTYAVSDDYQGDGNYNPASSSTDTVTVTPLSTTTALSSSDDPSLYSQAVTFTATVSPTDGGGTVSFTADGNALTGCSGQPLTLSTGSYQATCT